MKCFHLITTLTEDIKVRRANVDYYHNEYYQEALLLARDITVQKRVSVIEKVLE